MENPKKHDQSSNNHSKKKLFKQYARYSGIGFQMIAIVVIGVLIGKKADQHFQTEKPYFTAFFALLFVIIAMYTSIREFIRPKNKTK